MLLKDLKHSWQGEQDVDYGDFDDIDNKDAEDSIKIAEEIINMVDKKRKSMIEK